MVVVCQSGSRSEQAATELRREGKQDMVLLDGGMNAWEQSGAPVERGEARWALERQVRLVAGSIVLSSIVASAAVPRLKWVGAGIGGGRVRSGQQHLHDGQPAEQAALQPRTGLRHRRGALPTRRSLRDETAGSSGVALTCTDGRISQLVQEQLREEWGVDVVDLVTLPAPEAAVPDLPEQHAVWDALRISVQQHGSTRVAVVAHTDCAANAVAIDTRREQVRDAVFEVRDVVPRADVTGWLVDTATCAMDEVE